MIRQLKKDKELYQDLEEKVVNEDGSIIWNIPQDINEFKNLAIDTLMWQVGQLIKKASGGKLLDVITAISKIQVAQMHLLKKVLKNSQLNEEPENIQDTIEQMEELYSKGYSDSEKALNTITSVNIERDKLYSKVQRVTQAQNHDEVIAILNEE